MNDELFELYLANRLKPEDVPKLKQVLASDAQARTRFVQVLQEWQIFSEAARQITTGTTCSFEDEFAQRLAADGLRRRRPSAPRPRRTLVRRVAAVFVPLTALAACLALMVMLAPSSAKAEPLASISVAPPGVSLRRGEFQLPVVVGTQLQPGDALAVPVGVQAEIRYVDGTRVTVEPRTSLVLTALGNDPNVGKRVTIASGQVEANVSKQPLGQPMIFITPTAQAVVIGTRLTLVVSPLSTRLEVEQGRVGLVRNADRSTVEVATGQFAIVADGDELASRPLPRPVVPVVVDRRSNGLKAEYFDGSTFERALFTRVETGINADLGLEVPAFDNPHPANFTVRWTGQIEVRHSETHLFVLRADSGVRMYIGDRLLIDAWGVRQPKEHAASMAMEAGKRYPLRVEYTQPNSGMLISLAWASPSQPQEIVPIENLTQP